MAALLNWTVILSKTIVEVIGKNKNLETGYADQMDIGIVDNSIIIIITSVVTLLLALAI